ncbi:hypothetical protein PISMIDRAFT_679232, partial [Pisolithus microcarpus 441]
MHLVIRLVNIEQTTTGISSYGTCWIDRQEKSRLYKLSSIADKWRATRQDGAT